jgi:hypothetical protein
MDEHPADYSFLSKNISQFLDLSEKINWEICMVD